MDFLYSREHTEIHEEPLETKFFIALFHPMSKFQLITLYNQKVDSLTIFGKLLLCRDKINLSRSVFIQ